MTDRQLFLEYRNLLDMHTASLLHFMRQAEKLIYEMTDFSKVGIAPPEEVSPPLSKLSSSMHGHEALLRALYTLSDQTDSVLSDSRHFIVCDLHSYIRSLHELRCHIDLSRECMEIFCSCTSQFKSIADHWCAQKWLNGKSSVSTDFIIDMCLELKCSLTEQLYPATLEMISLMEATIVI